MIATIFRNRKTLRDNKRWQLIAARPFSVALFFGCMGSWGGYEIAGVPAMWRLALMTLGLISLSRLSAGVSDSSENKQFVYSMVAVLITTKLLELANQPAPLFRLYIVLTALTGAIFSLIWSAKSKHKRMYLYAKLFRLIALFLTVIILLELMGKTAIAFYLLISLLRTIAVVIAYLFFRYLFRQTLKSAFNTSLSLQEEAKGMDRRAIVRHAAIAGDLVLWGILFVPAILVIWKVYDSFGEAVKGFLSFGFEMASQRISIGLVIMAGGVLYATLVVSWIIQEIFLNPMLTKRQVEMGVRHAMAKLVRYFMVLLGFLLALSTLGFEVTKLTIVLSAFGVGIGFGLQGIVNNFVCGIILLLERPVRVGDMVEIGGRWAVIKRIGLRSATVTTFDEADLIIPNANMVNSEVTNWTLSNRRARIQIPLGVAYGSNVGLVIETLASCGKENPYVDKTTDPQVLFQRFGESSLEFELRVWVSDVDKRLIVKSEIHREIERKFREAKIEIAFPQLDLHLRTTDEWKSFRPLGVSR